MYLELMLMQTAAAPASQDWVGSGWAALRGKASRQPQGPESTFPNVILYFRLDPKIKFIGKDGELISVDPSIFSTVQDLVV